MSSLKDRMLNAVAFLAPPVAERRVSLSAQRAQDRWMVTLLGLMGRRIANEDAILSTHGSGDLSLWKDILDDERCYSCFQQRRLAVISRSWEVNPGAQDRKSKKAAAFLSAQLDKIGWDRICDRMLYGVWYGYAVGEAIWQVLPQGDEYAGLVGLERIDVPDRGWFGFDAEGRLRITDGMGLRDQPVPERKFWSCASGGDHDFVHYGVGLAHWLFWPVFFKRQGFPFWLRFLERFGTPTIKGKVKAGQLDTDAGKTRVLDVLKQLTSNSAVAVPEWLEVDLLDATRAGSGGYELLIDRCDAAITRVILSQSMTSEAGPAGLGSNQATVHKDVRDEVVRSDADLLHESFNRSIARWLTEFNFPGAVPPKVYRIMEDPEDLNALADRDTTLKGLGWRRTEDAFREVYGEGYEKAEEAEPVDPNMLPDKQKQLEQFAATDPQPLYVSRKLLNAAEFIGWAKRQGFKSTAEASDLHVTVLYSKQPVNWFDMAGPDWGDDEELEVAPGGPRKVERLGDEGAVVLHFASDRLKWRHDEMVRRGASHDYPEYLCHVTVTYDAGDIDLEKVEPYTGKLIFGPEIFAPIITDGRPTEHHAFAAADIDAIDRLVTRMGEGGTEAIEAFVAPLKDKLEGLDNPELLRIALLNYLETASTEDFAAALANPMLAVRAASEAGIGAEKLV